MAKTTFTVPEVPGSSRKSDRALTHAVIGRYDPQRAAAAEGRRVPPDEAAGALIVLHWSTSEAGASGTVATWSATHRDVRVVACVPVKGSSSKPRKRKSSPT